MKNFIEVKALPLPSFKFDLKMKLTALFLMITLISIHANETYAQKTKVSLNMSEVSIQKVLDRIESITEFKFFVNTEEVDVDEKVSIQVNNKTIEKILNKIFRNQNVAYKVIDKQIVLGKRNDPKVGVIDIKPQQAVNITGTVADQDGNPLPGASVVEKGTTNGTQTDFDGNFQIEITDDNAVLSISYIGYATKEVPVNGQTQLDVVLEEDTAQLEEVVVLGYQNKKRRNLTSSVPVIKTEQLAERPTASAADLLEGLVPGLNIFSDNPGRVGSGASGISIQGLALRQQGDPDRDVRLERLDVLVVIDGVPQPSGSVEAINSVNPKDIESISVLNDGEAAIYGSRAALGVIVIQTKKGGKPKINAGFATTMKNVAIYPRKANMIDMFLQFDEAWQLNGDSPIFGFGDVINYIKDNNITFDDIKNNDYRYVYGNPDGSTQAPFGNTPFLVFSHDQWYKTLFGTGFTQNYDFSASGASEKVNYYVSLGLIDEDPMFKYGNNNSKTSFGRVKVDFRLNDYINVGANVNVRYNNTVQPYNYDLIERELQGRFTYDRIWTPEGRLHAWGGFRNPVGDATQRGDQTIRNWKIQPQLYATIKPIEGLNITGRFQKNLESQNFRYLLTWYNLYRWNEEIAGPSLRNRDAGSRSLSANEFNQHFNGTVSAEYSKSFGDHTIRAFAGYTHEEFQFDQTNVWANGLVSDALTTVNLSDPDRLTAGDVQIETTLKGVLANLSYTYKDKYIVDGYFRSDGSSRFNPGFQWSDFFGVGARWNVSKEGFFTNLGLDKTLSNLAFRVNYGELGSQNGIRAYDFVQRVSITNDSNVLFGPNNSLEAQAASITGFPSDTRTWEINKKLNFGLDASLFNNRLGIVANTYKTVIDNAFFSQTFPEVLGASPPNINGAKWETKGWDLQLSWRDKLENGLGYNIVAGVSDADTETIALESTVTPRLGVARDAFLEGYPRGAAFGYEYDGIMQNQAEVDAYYAAIPNGGLISDLRPGDVRFKDLDGDGILEPRIYEEDENGNPTETSGDLVYIGENRQHYQYFVNLGVNYKGFGLSAILNGVGKWMIEHDDRQGYGAPWEQPLEHMIGNGWTPENPDATYPRWTTYNGSFSNRINNYNYQTSNAPWLWKDASWLQVKNIQLSYDFPGTMVDKIGLQSLRLYANGTDLGYIIRNVPKSYSPQRPYATRLSPFPRSFSFGINIGF